MEKDLKSKTVPLCALIDGDAIAYQMAWALEPHSDAYKRLESKQVIESVRNYIKTHIFEALPRFNNKYLICVGGKGNFRKQLDPQYKANRKDKEPPVYLNLIYKYLNKIGVSIDKLEADDVMAIMNKVITLLYAADKCDYLPCIVSPDKDLRTISGWNYHPYNSRHKTSGTLEYIDEDDAGYNFWYQMLIGDTADNIKGIDGIGEARAKRILELVDENNKIAKAANYEYWFTYRDAVYLHYVRRYGVGKGERYFRMNFDLLALVNSTNDARVDLSDLKIPKLKKRKNE